MYAHFSEIVFLTPKNVQFHEYKECYRMNSTCGVNFDVLKRMVRLFFFFEVTNILEIMLLMKRVIRLGHSTRLQPHLFEYSV